MNKILLLCFLLGSSFSYASDSESDIECVGSKDFDEVLAQNQQEAEIIDVEENFLELVVSKLKPLLVKFKECSGNQQSLLSNFFYILDRNGSESHINLDIRESFVEVNNPFIVRQISQAFNLVRQLTLLYIDQEIKKTKRDFKDQMHYDFFGSPMDAVDNSLIFSKSLLESPFVRSFLKDDFEKDLNTLEKVAKDSHTLEDNFFIKKKINEFIGKDFFSPVSLEKELVVREVNSFFGVEITKDISSENLSQVETKLKELTWLSFDETQLKKLEDYIFIVENKEITSLLLSLSRNSHITKFYREYFQASVEERFTALQMKGLTISKVREFKEGLPKYYESRDLYRSLLDFFGEGKKEEIKKLLIYRENKSFTDKTKEAFDNYIKDPSTGSSFQEYMDYLSQPPLKKKRLSPTSVSASTRDFQ